ncbi:MAG: glycosyltransferase family 4 protein [Singulisphaera sp.]
MKVGLVVRHFNPARGGAERWTYELARRALTAGHEVHVVAQNFGAPEHALPIVPHAVPKVHSPFAFALAIDETVSHLDLDLVHDMGFGWRFDILQPHFGAPRAQFDRKLLALAPWKRTLRRALTAVSPRWQQQERICWRQYADHRRLVIALSKLVARDLERTHGWPMERSRLIYNGVDLDRFTPDNRSEHRQQVRARLHIAEDELAVLFIAHNFALKGLPTLLQAVGQLRQRNQRLRLVVAGAGRDKQYRHLAERSGAENTQFLGAVRDTAPLYAAADVFALPTWYDSCSLVVLEALAAGVPVITTSHNGASEIMSAGQAGFVIENPGDWHTLAAHLQSLLDPATRFRMGVAARRLAEQYPIEGNYQQVLQLWQQVAGRYRMAA